MKRTIVALPAACAIAVIVASAAARPDGPPIAIATITIDPITATFIPAKRETEYSVSRYHINGKPTEVTVTWTLHLQLVDKAGAPDPGTPGSGAAVDLGCTNAGVGVSEPDKSEVKIGGVTTHFVWHHPDPADSVPQGRYHCDHQDMGPHGHQGLVKIVVADKGWECTATYKGTNSSTPESVKDGTASEPKCGKVG
jgi:hypothetical protein